MKSNNRVEKFIQDILSVDKEKGEVVIFLQKMILKICPEALQEVKYGGIVFNVGSELISGIFVSKNHISLEFGQGAKMQDPENMLEGVGKYRRHLKFMNMSDITRKDAKPFITQAFKSTLQ